MLGRVRARLTYANVMATAAVFIALGSSSYAALKLPRNSVGSKQLRGRSVGAHELKTGAVASRDIRNRGINFRDISLGTQTKLRGNAGPPGPPGPRGITFHAVINSGGIRVSGNAVRSTDQGLNGQAIYFAQAVTACTYSASLARVPGGAVTDPQPGSTITVAATPDGGVLVRTWDPAKRAVLLPFHLIVAC